MFSLLFLLKINKKGLTPLMYIKQKIANYFYYKSNLILEITLSSLLHSKPIALHISHTLLLTPVDVLTANNLVPVDLFSLSSFNAFIKSSNLILYTNCIFSS